MNKQEIINKSLENVFDCQLPKEVYQKANRKYIKARMIDSGYEFPDDYIILEAANKEEFVRNIQAATDHWEAREDKERKPIEWYIENADTSKTNYHFSNNYNNSIRMRAEFAYSTTIESSLSKEDFKMANEVFEYIHETNFCYTDIRERYGFVLLIPFLSVNSNYNLHNLGGPAISFPDGESYYFINGREVEAELFEKDITKEMFVTEKDADRQAAMAAIIEHREGENALFSLFDAEQIDEAAFTHKNGSEKFKLFKANVNIGQTKVGYFIEQICPTTGQKYYASVKDAETVKDAMLSTRDPLIPEDIPYEWEGFRT